MVFSPCLQIIAQLIGVVSRVLEIHIQNQLTTVSLRFCSTRIYASKFVPPS